MIWESTLVFSRQESRIPHQPLARREIRDSHFQFFSRLVLQPLFNKAFTLLFFGRIFWHSRKKLALFEDKNGELNDFYALLFVITIVNPIIVGIFAPSTIVNPIIMELYSFTDGAILKRMGQQLRRLRLEKNVSQKELAKSAGVSLSSVANIENGKSISLVTFIPLLRALGSLDLLAGFTEEAAISPIAYAKILEGRKEKKRASSPKSNNKTFESEW